MCQIVGQVDVCHCNSGLSVHDSEAGVLLPVVLVIHQTRETKVGVCGTLHHLSVIVLEVRIPASIREIGQMVIGQQGVVVIHPTVVVGLAYVVIFTIYVYRIVYLTQGDCEIVGVPHQIGGSGGCLSETYLAPAVVAAYPQGVQWSSIVHIAYTFGIGRLTVQLDVELVDMVANLRLCTAKFGSRCVQSFFLSFLESFRC